MRSGSYAGHIGGQNSHSAYRPRRQGATQIAMDEGGPRRMFIRFASVTVSQGVVNIVSLSVVRIVYSVQLLSQGDGQTLVWIIFT